MEKFIQKFSDSGLLFKIILSAILALALHVHFLSAYMGRL
jgi:hypothetical protein